MIKTFAACSFAALVLSVASTTALSEEAEMSGAELFKFHGCVNCHGADGKTPVSKLVPPLAGKPADELYTNATKILSGEGASEEAKLMHAAFYSPSNCDAPPTDAQVKSITAWLATQ
jgi:mono/diheme cytochrome c family protein